MRLYFALTDKNRTVVDAHNQVIHVILCFVLYYAIDNEFYSIRENKYLNKNYYRVRKLLFIFFARFYNVFKKSRANTAKLICFHIIRENYIIILLNRRILN